MNGASPDEVKKELAERLSYKAAHRDDMEKAPIKRLSYIDPIAHDEQKPDFLIFNAPKHDAPVEKVQPTEEPAKVEEKAETETVEKHDEAHVSTKKPISRKPRTPKQDDEHKDE